MCIVYIDIILFHYVYMLKPNYVFNTDTHCTHYTHCIHPFPLYQNFKHTRHREHANPSLLLPRKINWYHLGIEGRFLYVRPPHDYTWSPPVHCDGM